MRRPLWNTNTNVDDTGYFRNDDTILYIIEKLPDIYVRTVGTCADVGRSDVYLHTPPARRSDGRRRNSGWGAGREEDIYTRQDRSRVHYTTTVRTFRRAGWRGGGREDVRVMNFMQNSRKGDRVRCPSRVNKINDRVGSLVAHRRRRRPVPRDGCTPISNARSGLARIFERALLTHIYVNTTHVRIKIHTQNPIIATTVLNHIQYTNTHTHTHIIKLANRPCDRGNPVSCENII